MFLIALLLAGQQAAEQPKVPQSELPPAEVVITGNKMRDLLDKCLARNCPPEEEVDAAMNAGAEHFAAGRYNEAVRTLRQAISRNKRYASRMPGPISDLYATYADVAQHFGTEDHFRRATWDSVAVLRRALGETHPATIRASSRIGDMMVKLGRVEPADDAYREAAETAARAGNADQAAVLTFRRAWLALVTGRYAASRRFLDQIERDRGGDARFAPMLRVLRARIAFVEGDAGAIEALVAAMRGFGGAEPLLVYAPPYPAFDEALRADVRPEEDTLRSIVSTTATLDRGGLQWADIGFWVRADGTTSDIDVLRPARGTEWTRPLQKQIARRRYAPAAQAGDIGRYRIERFTLRSTFGVPTGTHIVMRYGPPALQVIDLTTLSARDREAPKP